MSKAMDCSARPRSQFWSVPKLIRRSINRSALGSGRNRIITVSDRRSGKNACRCSPPLSERTIVCIQAGNVNTGSYDPAAEICRIAHKVGAWVHVDGAFGLWAAAAPERAHLMDGVSHADSWATDGHKWLNVPYDCGLAFVRNRDDLRASIVIHGRLSYTGISKRADGLYAGSFASSARSRRLGGAAITGSRWIS